MEPRTDSQTEYPGRCGLSFERTCEAAGQLYNIFRLRIGAMEIVDGAIAGEDYTAERVALVVVPATGASHVNEWVCA